MAQRKISQRQGRAYKRELDELKRRTRSDRSVWGAVPLVYFTLDATTIATLKAVKNMGHPLACRYNEGTLQLDVYGVR